MFLARPRLDNSLMLSLPSSSSPVWLIVASLAVWRISAMICYERGPFGMLISVRRLLVRMSLHRLVTCFHCTAFWVSIVVVGILYGAQPLSLLVALGASGAASILERWLTGDTTITEESENDR